MVNVPAAEGLVELTVSSLIVIFCLSARVGSAAAAAKFTTSKSSFCKRVFSSPRRDVWLALI